MKKMNEQIKHSINQAINGFDKVESNNIALIGYGNYGKIILSLYHEKIEAILDNNLDPKCVDKPTFTMHDFDYDKFNGSYFIAALGYETTITKRLIESGVNPENIHYITEDKETECNICLTKANLTKFKNRNKARCPACGSLERHRLIYSYYEKTILLEKKTNKIFLHFAPESSLADRLCSHFGNGYISADLYNKKAEREIDITKIKLEDNSVDYIHCCHVLEHIENDKAAMSEIYRILKTNGTAFIMVPEFKELEVTYEDSSVTDPNEREKHFGQSDHVRKYGRDFQSKLEKSGFSISKYEGQDINCRGTLYICRKNND